MLHPEKFFAREAPRPVRIAYSPPRGQLLSEGVLGELLTRTFLSAGSADDAPAAASGAPPPSTEDDVQRAAAGWGGDAYRSWDVGGKTLLVWRSEWDGVEDAREFHKAVLRRLERTHGGRRNLQDAALFARSGWLMAVVGAADAVTVIASDDAALLPLALKELGGGGA